MRQIREVESALGDGRKLGPTDDEMEFYEKARRSVHAAVNIPAGTVISEEMLVCKRPGYGVRPKFLPLLAGRRALRDIATDEWITWEMV